MRMDPGVMTAAEAGPARLLRRVDGAWRTVGPVFPPLDDDDLHAASLAEGSLVYWHLPAGLAAGGDLLLVRERALCLLNRCGPSHRAVAALRAHMFAYYEPEWADAWCSRREVWSARVLAPPALAAVTAGRR